MDKQELLQALLIVKSGINVNGVDESMGYFYFSGENVITFNNTISIQQPLKTDFTTFIRGNDLVNLLIGTKSSVIDLKQKDTKVLFNAKNIKATLNTIEDNEFVNKVKAVQKSIKSITWFSLPKNFSECIKSCSTVHISGELDSVLSSALVNDGLCVSSDNQRVIKTKLDAPMDTMLIKCSEIDKLLSISPIKYGVSDNWLHFRNKTDCIFSLRKIEGDFPDILHLFDFEGDIVTLPKSLTDGINVTEIFVDSLSPYIRIHFKDNQCILAIDSKYGSIKHKSSIKYKGKPISFSINPEFLKSMIQHSTTVCVHKDKSKLKIETDNYSMITALYTEA